MTLQNQEIKTKKRRKTIYLFIFITSLSFGFVGSCVLAAVVDTSAFSLGSSFGGMVRIANTSSILWEVSFSSEVSLGAGGGSSKPWIASLLTSPAFKVSSTCSVPFVIAPIAGKALGGSAVESEEFWRRMAGGSIYFLLSSAQKKPQPWLGWGLHPIPRHNKSCT